MPALTASGNSSHRSTTWAKSGDFCLKSAKQDAKFFRRYCKCWIRLDLKNVYYGLANHCDDGVSNCSSNNCNDATQSCVFCCAQIEQLPSDLQAVIESWPNLPRPVKAGIVAMVKALRREEDNG